jgi:transcriptional regulator with XRE-family HTH domain
MATQANCFNALRTLRNRVKESAYNAGYKTVRSLSIATQQTDPETGKAHGVSRSGINKLYCLEHYPTLDTLLALARATDSNIEDWVKDLYQEDMPEPEPEPEPEPQPEPEPEPEPWQPEPEPEPEPWQPEPESGSNGEPEPETDNAPKVDILALLHGMKPTR